MTVSHSCLYNEIPAWISLHIIWFSKLFFEIIEIIYSFLNVFNIIRDRFPDKKWVSDGYKNVYFMYNIDKILYDNLMIHSPPSCVYLHVILYHRQYPDTHWIPKWYHNHVYAMFMCCNPIHHISSDHYPYIYLDKYLLRPEYKPLHKYYLKMIWDIVMEGKLLLYLQY